MYLFIKENIRNKPKMINNHDHFFDIRNISFVGHKKSIEIIYVLKQYNEQFDKTMHIFRQKFH